MTEQKFYESIGRPDMAAFYSVSTKKSTVIRKIFDFIFSEAVGTVFGFDGKVYGTDLELQFRVSEISPAPNAERGDYPLKGKDALFSEIISEVSKFSIIPSQYYITAAITIKDFFRKETF